MDDQTAAVSDPASPEYDPDSPFYDVTADSSSRYYVGPLAGGIESGGEIREQATTEVDLRLADEEHWTNKVVDPAVRDQRIQRLYEQRLDEARRGLDAGLELRPQGTVPRTAWDNASHEQMNNAIFTEANSATIAETSEEWVRVGNELADHQRVLADAIADSSADWQGSGGDAVREHLAGVGKWLGVTAQGAALTGRQQQIHSQALNETQKQMAANPPVVFSVQEANARLMQITDPVEYAVRSEEDLKVYRAQLAGRDQAARLMTQFDETVGTAVLTPAFPPPPKLPGSGSGSGGGASGGGAAIPAIPAMARGSEQDRQGPVDASPAPFHSVSPQSTTGQELPPGGVPPLAGSPSTAFGGLGEPPRLPSIDDSTRSTGYSPPTAPPGGGLPPVLPPSGVPPIPENNTPRGTVFPSGVTPQPLPTGTGPVGAPPVNPGRTPTIGRSGGINGDSIGSRLSGLSGLSGPDESSARGASPRGGSLGPGGSAANEAALTGGKASASGAAARAFEAESAAARGAGPGAGAKQTPGGAGGMGGAGAGKKGEEDKEHGVAEYIEGDKELFSSEEIVAPPVIGDWQNTDWR